MVNLAGNQRTGEAPPEAGVPIGSVEAPTVLRADGLSKRYGPQVAVDDVSFELPPGTVTGFVGPNGAGKTTTMRMLLGLVAMTSGRALLGGTDVGRQGALERVGALIEGPAFYPALSARRNLTVLAATGGLDRGRIDDLLAMTGLGERAGDPVRTFSLGMRQRLGIAAALLPDPEVVLLDEPTNGLDPAGIREIRALLRQLADDGVTVLVSSHLLAEIEQICDRLLVIRSGRVILAGSMEEIELRRRTEVVARPETSAELDHLSASLASHGHCATRDGDTLRLGVGAGQAAEVNRIAFAVGVTLAELRAETENLETTFFRLVGEDRS